MKDKILANDKFQFEIEPGKEGSIVNGKRAEIDVRAIDGSRFHILHKNQSFLADVVELNRADKYCLIKVNGNNYRLELSNQYDTLLQQLGLDSIQANKVNEVKAPMPGLVLSVSAKEDDEVKKGDNLFILEAMKMENIIKAPADGTVKAVKAVAGDKVEKGQTIITFV
ncbi:MAG: acetyl-CoA carboxylase biotin carboxyl carrier protein subunit [Sphingobacteriaceae bacterium]|jgi:biotin carboxyl carrier protein|nr:acetyl-CoA carboxylase biotin carboxyl carrier protein subunit [Sphingobacteriaceae bacterium]